MGSIPPAQVLTPMVLLSLCWQKSARLEKGLQSSGQERQQPWEQTGLQLASDGTRTSFSSSNGPFSTLQRFCSMLQQEQSDGTRQWHHAAKLQCFYHQHLSTSIFLSSGQQVFTGASQHEHSITFAAGVMPLELQHQQPDLQLTTDQPPCSCPFSSPFFTCRS